MAQLFPSVRVRLLVYLGLLLSHHILAQEHRASQPNNLAISVHNANVTNTQGKVYMADLKILLHGLDNTSVQDGSNPEIDELTQGMVRLGRAVNKLTETVANVLDQLPQLINNQIHPTTNANNITEDDPAVAVSTTPVQQCPEPFFSIFGECFYANVHQKLTWLQARQFCEGVGSDLAEPRDVNLLRLMLQEKFLSKTVMSFWVGAKKFKTKKAGRDDAASEAEWQWLSGLPVGDSNWIRGQPDNRFGNEDCLAMMKSFQPPLHDITCDHPDNFICERKRTANTS